MSTVHAWPYLPSIEAKLIVACKLAKKRSNTLLVLIHRSQQCPELKQRHGQVFYCWVIFRAGLCECLRHGARDRIFSSCLSTLAEYLALPINIKQGIVTCLGRGA